LKLKIKIIEMSKKKVKKNASMVWKYFSTEENGRKACSHDKCEKTYSASSATTCMITHL